MANSSAPVAINGGNGRLAKAKRRALREGHEAVEANRRHASRRPDRCVKRHSGAEADVLDRVHHLPAGRFDRKLGGNAD